MKRSNDGLMVGPNGPEDRARAIRRLEAWHRVWEIKNRERLTHPTFANEHEVTHDHQWAFAEVLTNRGSFVDLCGCCGVFRRHVDGTPSEIEKNRTK
jgi:hypothetical protein